MIQRDASRNPASVRGHRPASTKHRGRKEIFSAIFSSSVSGSSQFHIQEYSGKLRRNTRAMALDNGQILRKQKEHVFIPTKGTGKRCGACLDKKILYGVQRFLKGF